MHTYTDRHTRRCHSSSSDSGSFPSSISMTTSCSEASSYSSSSSAAAHEIGASGENDVGPEYGSLNWYVKKTQSIMPAVSGKSMQLRYSWGDDSFASDTVDTTALICSPDIMSWHWSQSGAVPPAR